QVEKRLRNRRKRRNKRKTMKIFRLFRLFRLFRNLFSTSLQFTTLKCGATTFAPFVSSWLIFRRSRDERDKEEEAAHVSRSGRERFSTSVGRHGDRSAKIRARPQPGRREDHGVRARAHFLFTEHRVERACDGAAVLPIASRARLGLQNHRRRRA